MVLLVLATVADGASPVAADTEVGAELEVSGAWVVSDTDDAGTDVVLSETVVVET